MRVSGRCPHPDCGKSFSFDDAQTGRKAKCKACGTAFVLLSRDESEDASSVPCFKESHEEASGHEGESEVAAHDETYPQEAALASLRSPDRLKKLGRFHISELLGAGAFGAVYKARDPQLDRDVALKLLQRTGDEKRDRSRIDRFLIEGRAAARLQHPAIVPVFDAGYDEATGEYYQAAAYIRGAALSSIVNGPLEPRRAAKIVRKLAEALDYAHSQGVLHRDIKPDNVMLDEHDEPHLMDFGLARIAEDEGHLTKDGSTLGTPAYMSPEQAAGKHTALTGASDQYSLGCLFYELLTGQTPFSGPAHIQIHLQINAEPEPPRQSQPTVDRDLETICLKSLSKNPADRYQTCFAFSEDLHRWLEGEPIRARRLTRMEQVVRWTRRNPAIAGLSLGTIVLLFLIAVISTAAAVRLKSLSNQERSAREAAQQSAQKEKDAARVAETERQRASEQAEIAQRETRRTRELLYSADMNLAKRAWDDGHAAAMKSYLNQYVPQNGQPEVRGFEWFYLNRLINDDVMSFKAGTRVTSLGFTPDGSRLISVGDEYVQKADGLHTQHVLKIWDKTTWECVRTIPLGKSGSWYPSQRIAISPDGSLVAVAAQTPETFAANSTSDWRFAISIFDLTSGALRTTLALGKETAHHIDWRHDGKQLLTVSDRDDWLRLWDVETGQEVCSVPKKNTRGPAWFVTGRNIEIAACDGRDVTCFDLTGTETRRVQGPPAMITDLAFDAGHNSMATLHTDSTVRLWSASTSNWREMRSLKGDVKDVRKLTFTPDGKRLLTFGSNPHLRVWMVDTGEEEFALKGHVSTISAVAVSPDSQSVASATHDGEIRYWNLSAQADSEYLTLREPNDTQHHNSHLSADGQSAVCVFTDRIEIIDTSTRQLIRRIEDLRGDDGSFLQTGQPLLALSGNGKRLAMTNSFGEFLRVWDASTGERLLHLSKPGAIIPENANSAAPLLDFTFTPDGTQAIFHFLFSLARFEIPSGKLKDVIPFNTGGAWGSPHRSEIVFSPDGTLAAMRISSIRFSNDVLGTAVFRVADWQRESLVKTYDKPLAISHNNRWLAIPDGYGVTLHEVTSGKVASALTGHNARVTAAAFLPGDTRIATASEDGTVKLWNPYNGREMLTLEGSRAVSHALVFSSDSTRLILAADDTERIWEAAPASTPQP